MLLPLNNTLIRDLSLRLAVIKDGARIRCLIGEWGVCDHNVVKLGRVYADKQGLLTTARISFEEVSNKESGREAEF